MRYAVTGATIEQVKSVGGVDVKEAPRTGIIFATLTSQQVERLRSLGCQVNPIGKVKPTVMPPVPVAGKPTYTLEQLVWAAGLEELRSLTSPPLYGEGTTIAIVDSGIRKTHEKISSRVVYEKNFTSDRMGDTFDHGTGVCSVALGVAPLAKILNMKVLDDKGMGTEEEVVLAIDDCMTLYDEEDIAPLIINLSLGAPDDGNPSNPLRVACRAALERGIWVVASAGNGGPSPETITSPACEKYVGAVGSAKLEPFEISYFSSRGPTKEGLVKPDAVLFGEDVNVASSSSDTATVGKSGTSFAAPFGAGLIALTLEGLMKAAGFVPGYEETYETFRQYAPMSTQEELLDFWTARITVKPENVPTGKDNDYGWGLPYGPLIRSAVTVVPLIDISATVGPLLAIAMLGMVMVPMTKAFVGGSS